MKKLYEAQIINQGGRTGRSFSPDNKFSVQIAPPKEVSGVETTATNPEELFAAGYSACFHQALQSAFRRMNLKAEYSEVEVKVSLMQNPEERSYQIETHIHASIKGLSTENAEKSVALAHTICPYSKAIQGNVLVTLETTVLA